MWTNKLNIFKRGEEFKGLSTWQSPDFLFFIFGLVIIAAIFITNILAKSYAGPELAALLSTLITIPLVIIAYSVVKSFEYLRVAYKMKSEFIKVMSHELRAPLISINWQLESFFALKNEGTVAAQAQAEEKLIKSVREQNARMLGLINKFIILKKIEEDNFILNKEEFLIYDLAQEIAEQKNTAIGTRAVFVNSAEKNLALNADKEKIKIAFENIIDNAVKYSVLKKDIEVFIEKIKNNVKITVSDKGRGIKKETVKSIFKKFGTARLYEESSPLTAEEIPGLRVGLYISKKIIESHKGKIDFKTEEGKGSTFWFILAAA